MTVEAVISTGSVARDQMVIDPEGWDFTNYRQNPVVLWGHDDSAMPVARTVGEIVRGPNELVATAEFDRADPEAARIFGKIQRGFVNSTSVRWLPKRTEIRNIATEKGERETVVFVEQELLEWSFVSIPADPGAVILRADGTSIDVDALMQRLLTPGQSAEGIAAGDVKLTVREHIDALLDYIEGEPDQEVLRELHTHLITVFTEPVAVVTAKDDRVLKGIERIAEGLEALAATPAIDVDVLLVRAVATATGRSEERVRAELAQR